MQQDRYNLALDISNGNCVSSRGSVILLHTKMHACEITKIVFLFTTHKKVLYNCVCVQYRHCTPPRECK